MAVGLVIIDTLSRSINGGDENGPVDMGRFVANCDKIRKATGCHVLVVHHTGKDTSKGARGHSLLRAAMDTEIELVRDNGTDRDKTPLSRATVTKQRDGQLGDVFAFELDRVDLGLDADGDAVTTCVIRPVDVPAATKNVRLTPMDNIAVACLRNLIIGEGVKTPQASAFPSAGHILCAQMSRFRAEFYKSVPDGTDRDYLRKLFRKECTKLQDTGIIHIYDELVWLPGQAGQTGTN